MAPGHRDLANDIFQLARDKQNLRVEAPALNRLQPKDHLRDRPLEGLESALRVFERQSHYQTGDPVETPSEELPVERLMDRLPRPVHPARPDRYIRTVRNRRKQ